MLDCSNAHQSAELASEMEVGAYLDRCQVDTPLPLVRLVWSLVRRVRPKVESVVDLGCGDARFAKAGIFSSYTGFEIDPKRAPVDVSGFDIRIECAFAAQDTRNRYAACVGNPPYVRHHDLAKSWLSQAETRLSHIEGYVADGRSNAYVYFMWLALDCVVADGLVALIVPYEWVSRPASGKLRQHIRSKGWQVDIYYLADAGFERVLTTACIVLIDKAQKEGAWRLHEIASDGSEARRRNHLTGTKLKRLAYERPATQVRAARGLSPGGQKHFVLTEELRIRHRLAIGRDVLPAVTSFRHLDTSKNILNNRMFRDEFVNKGKRCWLIRPNAKPHPLLQTYLDHIPESIRENFTCTHRQIWWQFVVPDVAEILYASGFKGKAPKMVRNDIRAVHVGAVHGIYCRPKAKASDLLGRLRKYDFGRRVVPLSNGFLKVEVNQMNAVLNQLLA